MYRSVILREDNKFKILLTTKLMNDEIEFIIFERKLKNVYCNGFTLNKEQTKVLLEELLK